MALISAAYSRRSGQDAPRRHIPSQLSEDETWILEQSGWATYEWDVGPEDEKAISEGRVPNGAFIPPQILLESAPLVIEDSEKEDESFDGLFGDDTSFDYSVAQATHVMSDLDSPLPPLDEEFVKLLTEQLLKSEDNGSCQSNTQHLALPPAPTSAPAPTRVTTPAPSSIMSLQPPLFPMADSHPRTPSPDPSSVQRTSIVTPAMTRRVRDLRSSMSTPDLSPSGSSASSDADSDAEHDVGSSFVNTRTSYHPSSLKHPYSTISSQLHSSFPESAYPAPYPQLQFGPELLGNQSNFGGAFDQASLAAFNGNCMTVSSDPHLQFQLSAPFVDYPFNPSHLDLDFVSLQQQQGAIGPQRTLATGSRISSLSKPTTPYSRRNGMSVSAGPARLRKRARGHRSNSEFLSDEDISFPSSGSSMRCSHCSYVQRPGAGDARSFKRHLETHPENKSFKWQCRGHPEADGVYRGGCGKTFARKDALQRHVKGSKGACLSDCSPIVVAASRSSSIPSSPAIAPAYAPSLMPSALHLPPQMPWSSPF